MDPDVLAALARPAVAEALEGDPEQTEDTLNEALAALVVMALVALGFPEAEAEARASSFVAAMARPIERTRTHGELDEDDDGRTLDTRIDLIADWMGTASWNWAQEELARATLEVDENAVISKTWVTRLDDRVRHIHAELHGATRDIGDTFTVASDPPVQLQYPGQPVGPLEAWINCRCLLQVDIIASDNTIPGLVAATPGSTVGRHGLLQPRPPGGGDVASQLGQTARVSDRPWDGSAGRFNLEQWCRSTLIHLEDGCETKSNHKLPIREPNGDLSRAGVFAAAARLNQTDAPPDKIASARRALRGAYRELKVPEGEWPDVIKNSALTAAGAPSGVVIVALPSSGGEITYADGDTAPLHQTLAYLGSVDDLQEGEAEAVVNTARSLAASVEPFTAKVAGRATLGDDGDEVAITEARELQSLHNAILNDPLMLRMYEERNAHPTWISHITGLDASPGDEVAFDRLAAWVGPDREEFTLAVNEQPPDEDEPPVPEEPIDAEDQNLAWHGVLMVLDAVTGDRRLFESDGFDYRELPQPLQFQRADVPGHDGAVTVATIENIGFHERPDGAIEVRGDGNLISGIPETEEVILLASELGRLGVSADLDMIRQGIPETDEELEALFMGDAPEVFTGSRLSKATIVAMPAFAEAWIALGSWDEADDENPVPDEQLVAAGIEVLRRGSGWVTHPTETRRLHRYWIRGEGAAKIGWGTPGDFRRCRTHLAKYINPRFLNRTCAEWHHDATGIWPGDRRNPGNQNACEECEETSMSDADTQGLGRPRLVAAAPATVYPRDWFADPGLTEPTPLRVEGDRVYGHLATWGQCHIGHKKCVEPPRSMHDYAYFHLGSIETDEGRLPVGSITMNTGHADLFASSRAAAAHYDDTGCAVAAVRAGEDAHGIWVAGAIYDGVPEEDARLLEAAGGISGDWREIGGHLELVAALAVNVPGFPIPHPALAASASDISALVAAGVVQHDGSADLDALADLVLDKMEARERRASSLASLKQTQRETRVAALREG